MNLKINLNTPTPTSLLKKPPIDLEVDEFEQSGTWDEIFMLGHQVPLAAIKAIQFQAVEPMDDWASLELVHLHATRDHIVLLDPEMLKIMPEEEQMLRISVQEVLNHFLLNAVIPTGSSWLFCTNEFNSLKTSSIELAKGRNIDVWMAKDTEKAGVAKKWRQMQNEIQMIWHDHPINLARYERGELPINSVWLQGGGASAEVIDTAYHAHLARIMAEMAGAIGRDGDAARYAKLHDEVKAAFVREFLQADGSLKGCSQTGYALAFSLDLLPTERRGQVALKFVDEVKRFDWHLATGFIGTPRLLPALSLAGRDDVAYKLLFTDTYPSWLFPVKNGATTMWERWNGWTPDKGFGDIGMNSFNHYAFGAVGEYLYGGVGGIKAASPGYKTIIIKPAIGEGLAWANTAFDSIYGRIVSNWKREGAALTMDVMIPPNTTALVYVPAKNADMVTESGKPAAKADGLKFMRMENSVAVYSADSGTYRFQTTLAVDE